MSEEISYGIRAFLGEANQTLQGSLRRRGLFFRDVEAWQAARDRADAFSEVFEKEMRRVCESSGPDLARASEAEGSPFLEVTRAEAMLASFSGSALFDEASRQLKPQEYQAITEGIGRLHTILNSNPPSLIFPERGSNGSPCLFEGMNSDEERRHLEIAERARALQARVHTLASQVQETLCRAEQDALLDTTCSALNALGYLVEKKGNSVKAIQGQNCLWAQAGRWGELDLDFTGLSGLECLKEVKTVEDELGRRGILLKNRDSRVHGRRDGGAIAKRLSPHFPVFRSMERGQLSRKANDLHTGKRRLTQ